MNTSAGRFSTRVTIQRLKATTSINAAGHIDESDSTNWETFCQRWVAVRWQTAAERLVGDQAVSQVAGVMETRSDSKSREITTDMRVRYGGAIYSIAGPPVDVDEANRIVQFPIKRTIT